MQSKKIVATSTPAICVILIQLVGVRHY